MNSSLLEEKIENFSNLSDEECGKILENNLLEGLESDTLLEREMISKFLVYTYPGREPLRKIFNLAVKKNKQKVGNFTVGQWLEKYIKTYDGKERTPNTFFEFVRENPETKILPKIDQTRLMRIFRMYDYLLVEAIFELDDIRMGILKFPMYINDGAPRNYDQEEENEMQEEEVPRQIVSMPLQEALGKFSNLGEQSVTMNPLKLKYFPNPMRPSVKNWITDFHDNMGGGKHSAIDRGNYLFHSENGKRLTPLERQKLSLILKSLEENSLLAIDPGKQIIVFQQTEDSVQNTTNTNTQEKANQNSDSSTSPSTRFARSESAQNDNGTQNEKRGVEHFFGKENRSGDAENDVFQKYFSVGEKTGNANISKPEKQNEIPIVQKKAYSPNFAEHVERKTLADYSQNLQKRSEQPEVRERKEGGGNYFSNFASAGIQPKNQTNPLPESETISFSFPQKLPVEQKEIEAKNEEKFGEISKDIDFKRKAQTQSKIQMNNVSFSGNQTDLQSRWHIKPRSFDESNNDVPKNPGIVDLRNQI